MYRNVAGGLGGRGDISTFLEGTAQVEAPEAEKSHSRTSPARKTPSARSPSWLITFAIPTAIGGSGPMCPTVFS